MRKIYSMSDSYGRPLLLEKILLRNEDLYEQFRNNINKYVTLGHTRLVPAREVNGADW